MTATMRKCGLMAAAFILAFAPVLLAPVPGFVDMPSHMARHHVLANIGHDALLSHWFVVHWQWIANLGVDLPAVLLTPVLGSERATVLVSVLLAPLMVVGMFALSRAVHGRVSATAYIALPFAMHQAWMWGFLNYCMGAALALLVAAWIYAKPRNAWGEQVMLGLFALAVWTAHMASWVILLVLAAGNELGGLRSARDVWPAVRRNWTLLFPLAPLLLWRSRATGPGAGFSYVDFLDTKLVVFASVLRGTDKLIDLALLGAVFAASVLAFAWAGGRRCEPRLLISGALLTLATLAAPTTILNAWGTDLRTAPLALAVLILAIGPARRPDREHMLCLIGMLLFLVRVGAVARAWMSHGHVLEERLTVLDAVPRGAKVGYVWIARQCGFPWRLVPDEKLGSYAVVRRDAFVNTLFMVDNAVLMRIRDPGLAARWHDGSQDVRPSCPNHQLDRALLTQKLLAMRGDHFDAVWVSGAAPAALPVVPGYRVARTVGDDTLLTAR